MTSSYRRYAMPTDIKLISWTQLEEYCEEIEVRQEGISFEQAMDMAKKADMLLCLRSNPGAGLPMQFRILLRKDENLFKNNIYRYRSDFWLVPRDLVSKAPKKRKKKKEKEGKKRPNYNI